jgi:hypothetical protein
MRISPQNSEHFHKWLFLLERHEGEVALVLQQRNNDTNIFDIEVEEPTTQATPPASIRDIESDATIIKYYNLILSSFYSLPFVGPSSSITSTLSLAESLVSIASSLNCTHLISASLSALLHSYRRTLYTSIAADPARYLALALSLHDSSIYTESLIHIIGAWPCWPWSTKRETLPAEILDLVVRKAEDLEQMCVDADRDLLLLTIQIGNAPVEPSDHAQFDTWFVVQLFRDTLARTLHELDGDKKKSLKRGSLYRKLRHGGADYMPYEEMRRVVGRVMPSALECLEEDLGMLKDHASRIVREVTGNELVLDVEESNVGYLTCMKVGREDLPWPTNMEG